MGFDFSGDYDTSDVGIVYLSIIEDVAMIENSFSYVVPTYFDKIFHDIIWNWEGWDKVTEDSGGVSKWGISQKSHPTLDIANLTEDQAKAIYKSEYWDKMRLDEVESYWLCKQLFQQGINQGIVGTVMALQQAMGLLGTELKLDGKVGPITLHAVNSYPNPSEIIWCLKGAQYSRYVGMVVFDGSQKKYFKGWLRRTFLT